MDQPHLDWHVAPATAWLFTCRHFDHASRSSARLEILVEQHALFANVQTILLYPLLRTLCEIGCDDEQTDSKRLEHAKRRMEFAVVEHGEACRLQETFHDTVFNSGISLLQVFYFDKFTVAGETGIREK